MKITTKTGDKGETSLFTGRRVKKTDVLVDLLGELDELNSFLGVCKFVCWGREVDNFEVLEKIQNDLYGIMAVVGNEFKRVAGISGFSDKDVIFLENEMKKREMNFPGMSKFILPGSSAASANFHVARCVCRRVERKFCVYLESVLHSGVFNEEQKENADIILKYLNRLSDLLFVLGI